MNVNILTQKSIEAVQAAQQLASERGNTEVTQAHLLYSLAAQPDGLIGSILSATGVEMNRFRADAEREVEALPTYSAGSGSDQIYISQDLNTALNEAEKRAKEMGDQYVSVEHLFLGLLKKANEVLKKLYARYDINEKSFLEQLKNVRGNKPVTTDNPEGTYDVLNKYGQDLVELARNQKLDPVIGRDDEIRSVVRILSRKTKNNPVLIGEPGVGKDRYRGRARAAHRARRRAG